MKNNFFIKETPSTNALLWKMIRENNLPEGFVVSTDFQTAGKGQRGNSWESNAGDNLLFSIVLYPDRVPVEQQFILSQLVSVGIKKALDEYTDNITVKWPNDIYWNDSKLAGILIENSIQGGHINSVVIGVGLNVNQIKFVSDAPNPVSLRHITGKRQDRKSLLKKICTHIMNLYNQLDAAKISSDYAEGLYRKEGFHSFRTPEETFRARICTVHPDGLLELETESGERRRYYFKEVEFVI